MAPRRGKPSVGAQIEGVASVDSGAREPAPKLPEWTRDAARELFTAQTIANGALLTGGFGFLHPNTQREWQMKAYCAVMSKVDHPLLPCPVPAPS